ncbi:MAG: bifunctional phosphopantothenoylcysteine decarboxylase/phosphopantothenate--cysteine ligase CoaBC [Candidatus Methylomirabilales bacterium]
MKARGEIVPRFEGRAILLGVTGSIAAYKGVELLRELTGRGAEVRVVMTEAATRFVAPLTFATLSRHPVLLDPFRLDDDQTIAHVKAAERADLLLVAPATAHTIAKFAHGLADDLLTNLYLAARCPVLLAPAMDYAMYGHPSVRENLDQLRRRGVWVVDPGVGPLASGLQGEGRLADLPVILAAVEALLGRPGGDLAGERILVSAGPTQEAMDPVRMVTNRSSGKMGFALAEAAARRGAQVTLVTGPVGLPTPAGVTRIEVRTALEMREALLAHFGDSTCVLMAAAIADYRPADPSPQKLKKRSEVLAVELVRNPDILEELGRQKGSRILVGFAAESENLLGHAREKLRKKNLDLIVANDITEGQAGFAVDTNQVTLLLRDGTTDKLPLLSKGVVADLILDRLQTLRSRARPADA